MKKFKFFAGLAAAGIIGLTAYELIKNKRIAIMPANTPRAYDIQIHNFLGALDRDEAFDAAQLNDSFLFIKNRYDCSDFLVNSLLRAMYAYHHKLDAYQPHLSARMKELLLDFKYHWDQNGADSLCTWSENHQILFAGAEYLAGHLYEDEIFYNSGRTGAYHKARGKQRILEWCKRRFRFGFTEWYSNNYYLEDLAAMSNIQEFAPDSEVQHAMTQILHLIFFDMATQSFKGSFVSTGGRMYEDNKKSAKHGCQLNSVIMKAFGMKLIDSAAPFHEELTIISHGMDYNFLLNKSYKVPTVIKSIAKDSSEQIIKQSNSVDIDEGMKMSLFGNSDAQLAAQWEMEAFTNHQVFGYTMKGLKRNNMFCSQFMGPLRLLNLTVLKPFYGLLAKTINPITNGKATQRANTYTYRNKKYFMATTQNYLPGGYSDQQHLWHVTLSHEVCVFATHPSGELEEKGALSKSPGYWVGNGRNPHAAQHENTILAIYHLPTKNAAFENHVYQFTHAYFPAALFDETVLNKQYAVGKLGTAFVALIGASELELCGNDELKQYGAQQFWICICSSKETESFNAFVDRIQSTTIDFNGSTLSMNNLTLNYQGDFYVDGCIVPTQYKRFDSAYCVAERDADHYIITHKDKSLEVRL